MQLSESPFFRFSQQNTSLSHILALITLGDVCEAFNTVVISENNEIMNVYDILKILNSFHLCVYIAGRYTGYLRAVWYRVTSRA
jgi:hypothetical protein